MRIIKLEIQIPDDMVEPNETTEDTKESFISGAFTLDDMIELQSEGVKILIEVTDN